MNDLRSGLAGLLAALLSAGIVFGGFSLSLVEGGLNLSPSPTEGLQDTPILPSPVNILPGTSLPTLLPTRTRTATPTPGHSFTVTPPAACLPPEGWLPYAIRREDSLASLAQVLSVTVDQLAKANCLLSASLIPGTVLYLPALPSTPTLPPTHTLVVVQPSPIPCGAPYGWIRYPVQREDTLFRLSLAFGISISELQIANCMGGATVIRAGSLIYVPNIPTRTLTPSPIAPTSLSPTPTSGTPLPSQTPAPTLIPTLTPPATTQPGLTQTLSPAPSSATSTPQPQATPTQTPVPLATQTPVPLATLTPTSILPQPTTSPTHQEVRFTPRWLKTPTLETKPVWMGG